MFGSSISRSVESDFRSSGPIVEIRHELPPDQRACPACGGALTEMAGQTEETDRITAVKLTYQVEHHVRQKYRCACNGAVVTAPGPAQVIPGGRYAPAFGVAEFYYLGALLYRKALAAHLDRWIADGMCNTHEAERIVRLIASENARRIYPLE